MTTRLWWLMWVPVVALACSGKTAVHETGDPQCKASGGCADAGPICKNGDTKPADDGCNTCTCSEGGWACTERACPAPACSDGDTKPAGDGCNTCTCSGGQWQCTLLGCELMCQEGDTKAAPDGCNTCTCSGNQWLCTQRACACKNGDTMQADCNTCVCMNGGWACTTQLCGKACGGWAGNTCASDEYCAYQPGSACGATDAEATCKKRPQACTTDYAPVCGCDAKTYPNECAASSAGVGIMSLGACTYI